MFYKEQTEPERIRRVSTGIYLKIHLLAPKHGDAFVGSMWVSVCQKNSEYITVSCSPNALKIKKTQKASKAKDTYQQPIEVVSKGHMTPKSYQIDKKHTQ